MAFLDTQEGLRKAAASSWLQYHLGQSTGYYDYQRSVSNGSAHKKSKNFNTSKLQYGSTKIPDGAHLTSSRPALHKSQSNLEFNRNSSPRHPRNNNNDINTKNLWWVQKDNTEDNRHGSYKLTHTRPTEASKMGMSETEEAEGNDPLRRSARQRLLGTTRSPHGTLLPLRKPHPPSFKEMKFFDTSAIAKTVNPASNHSCSRFTGASSYTSANGYPMKLRRGTSDMSGSHLHKEYLIGSSDNINHNVVAVTECEPSKRNGTVSLTLTHTSKRNNPRSHNEVRQCSGKQSKDVVLTPPSDTSVAAKTSSGEVKSREKSTTQDVARHHLGSVSSDTNVQLKLSKQKQDCGNSTKKSKPRVHSAKLAKLKMSDYFCVTVEECDILLKDQDKEYVSECQSDTQSEQVNGFLYSVGASEGSDVSLSASYKGVKRTVRFSVDNEVLEYEPWEPLLAVTDCVSDNKTMNQE